MTRKELADRLGISASMVSRLAKMGMPTNDVERARRWRARHLRVRMPDRCPPPVLAPAMLQPARVDERLADELHPEVVERLAMAAHDALDTGVASQMLAGLRHAMRLVRPSRRPGISMPERVWDALTHWYFEATSHDEQPRTPGDPAAECDSPDLPADAFGRFLYLVAIADPGSPIDQVGVQHL